MRAALSLVVANVGLHCQLDYARGGVIPVGVA